MMEPQITDLSQLMDERTRRLLNSVYDGIYVVNLDGQIIFWNEAAAKITGYSSSEVVGKNCGCGLLDHINEFGELVCALGCPLKKAIVDGIGTEAKLYPRHKDGNRFPIVTHIGPLRQSEGKIVGAIEVFRDVSIEDQYRTLQEDFERIIKKYVSKDTYLAAKVAAKEQETLPFGRKTMTVMFMDVVGFTPLSENHEPEVVLKTLNTLFEAATRIVGSFGGDIDKFIGDCIMAVFDNAEDAVSAAREFFFTQLPILNKGLLEMGLPTLQLRMGIDTGEVVYGDLGGTERKDRTVIGDTVNTASRVESAAPPGGFLISERTFNSLTNQEGFSVHGHVKLKGKVLPIKLFEGHPLRKLCLAIAAA